jgi:hypothetical protein
LKIRLRNSFSNNQFIKLELLSINFKKSLKLSEIESFKIYQMAALPQFETFEKFIQNGRFELWIQTIKTIGVSF